MEKKKKGDLPLFWKKCVSNPNEGYWCLQTRDKDGTRRQISTGIKTKKLLYPPKEAISIARDLDKEAYEPKTVRKEISLSEGIELFMKSHSESAKNTKNNYRNCLAHCLRILGNKNVSKITRNDISKLVETRRTKEQAEKITVRQELGTLRSCMRFLNRRGYFDGDLDIFTNEELSKFSYQPRQRWLSSEEFQLLLDWFAKKAPKWRDYLLGYVLLGCRRRELFAITSEHVDFKKRLVFIAGTKTQKAKRYVPFGDEMEECFKRRINEKGEGAVLFPETYAVYHKLKDACRHFGWQTLTNNDLRRTFASLMLNNDVPAEVIKELTGHTTTRMIDKTYGKIFQETKQRAISALNEAAFKKETMEPQKEVAPSVDVKQDGIVDWSLN